MRLIISIVFLAVLFTATVFTQNKSVYTSTKTSACRTIESHPDEGGSYIGECSGVGGYKIQLLEGDIRQTLNIITPARKKFELDFWSLFPSFSAIGGKIEWRTKGGVPVALITQYSVADPEGVKKDASYLLVSKIGKTQSCVTDIVKPGPNQNADARVLADAASTKPCKRTE